MLPRMPTKTFTKAQQSLFESGYPYFARLVKDHPDDAPKARDKALKKLIAATDPVYFVDWPQSVAAGFVHAFGTSKRKDRTGSYPAEPPGAELVGPWVKEVITRRSVDEGAGVDYGCEIRSFLFLLEAWHGTDKVLDALVSAYEALAKLEAGNKQCKNYAADEALLALTALLARAGDKARTSARKRLADVLKIPDVCAAFVFLDMDMALNGRAAMKRHQYKYVYPQAFLFSDDADLIAEGTQQFRGSDLEPRALWLGGDGAFAPQLDHARKVPAAAMSFVIESLAMFDTPEVVALMFVLSTKKGGEAATAWLDEHPALVNQKLDELKKAPGALGKAAKAFVPSAPSAAKPSTKGAKGKAPPKQKAPVKTKTAKPKKQTLKGAEKEFDQLVDWIVSEIEKVRGNKKEEEAAWVEAAERYIAIRSSMNEPGEEYLGHFFMVDGVGLEQERETAWDRLKPTAAESKRWGKLLE